jgi:hypothetical protein
LALLWSGCHRPSRFASPNHPQAEATAQQFCNAWVKLIAMVIESLVEELVGPDTLTIEVFGSRLLDSDVDLFLGPAARYPGEDIMFHIMSRMTTLKPQT